MRVDAACGPLCDHDDAFYGYRHTILCDQRTTNIIGADTPDLQDNGNLLDIINFTTETQLPTTEAALDVSLSRPRAYTGQQAWAYFYTEGTSDGYKMTNPLLTVTQCEVRGLVLVASYEIKGKLETL